MVITVSEQDATTRMAELLVHVDRGAIVILTRNGVPVAQVIPLTDTARLPRQEAVNLRDRLHIGPESMNDVTGPMPTIPT